MNAETAMTGNGAASPSVPSWSRVQRLLTPLSLSLSPLSHSLTHFHTHYRNHCCRITSYPACFPSDSSSMATTVLPTPTNLPLPLLLHSSHLSFFIVFQNLPAQILLKQTYMNTVLIKPNKLISGI